MLQQLLDYLVVPFISFNESPMVGRLNLTLSLIPPPDTLYLVMVLTTICGFTSIP